MKRTLIVYAIAIASSSSVYAHECADTLKVVSPREVILVSDSTFHSVSIKGSADDPQYTYYRRVDVGSGGNVYESEKVGALDFSVPFSKKPKSTAKARFEVGLFNIYGGAMVHANPNPYQFGNWTSQEGGISVLRYKSRQITPFFYVTASIGARLLEFTSTEDVMYHKVDGGISMVPVPDNMNLKFSKVKVASANIPIFLNFYSRKDKLGMSLGPVLNFNCHSKIKNVYSVGGGEKQKDKENNIHAKPVSVDYMALVRLSDFAIYVKWSPHGIFDTSYNKDVRALNVGIIFNIFGW